MTKITPPSLRIPTAVHPQLDASTAFKQVDSFHPLYQEDKTIKQDVEKLRATLNNSKIKDAKKIAHHLEGLAQKKAKHFLDQKDKTQATYWSRFKVAVQELEKQFATGPDTKKIESELSKRAPTLDELGSIKNNNLAFNVRFGDGVQDIPRSAVGYTQNLTECTALCVISKDVFRMYHIPGGLLEKEPAKKLFKDAGKDASVIFAINKIYDTPSLHSNTESFLEENGYPAIKHKCITNSGTFFARVDGSFGELSTPTYEK